MPWSDLTGKRETADWLGRHPELLSFVDFGAGAGAYAEMLRAINPGATRIAVEVWEPYITEYKLHDLYDQVIVADMRTISPLPVAQCAIVGDVLEHLTKDEGLAFLQKIDAAYPHVILNVPVGDWPQGPECGNDYERHLSTWCISDLLAALPGYAVQRDWGRKALFIKQP